MNTLKVIAMSALFAGVGTAGLACSAGESAVLSAEISAMAKEIVAEDAAHLGPVMGVMQAASVTEYHAGPNVYGCTRQVEIYNALSVMKDEITSESSAMLKQGRL